MDTPVETPQPTPQEDPRAAVRDRLLTLTEAGGLVIVRPGEEPQQPPAPASSEAQTATATEPAPVEERLDALRERLQRKGQIASCSWSSWEEFHQYWENGARIEDGQTEGPEAK